MLTHALKLAAATQTAAPNLKPVAPTASPPPDSSPAIATPDKPESPAAPSAVAPTLEPQTKPTLPEPSTIAPTPARTSEIPADLATLFAETDAVRINLEIFNRLQSHFALPVQDAHFSLPFVFDDRRFEIINFDQSEVSSVMELRSENFYGFYLSHISAEKALLVYACNGTHLEWGPNKCVLQHSTKSEPDEYKSSALLGIAQDANDEFVFVVTPAFREWAKPREKSCAEQNIHFVTIPEFAATRSAFKLIWPRLSKAEG
ncbi:MAG TPA: hypothetical protein VFR12_06650 [Pyrinomonadaceae bacterium]|nr:hypothetical protein [Pyrinomonadaceae bacterium]